MSEKQKSVTETTEKAMTKYDRKVQKRKEEEQKAQKRKTINKMIGVGVVLAIVAFIAYFPISKYVATHSTYATVGEYNITEVEFDYYYNAGVNEYISQYGSYLSYIGLDTTKDLATQSYNGSLTWDDYFQQNAINEIKRTKALLNEAKTKGFEYDTEKEVENHMETLKAAAVDADMTADSYVKAYFGKYATMNNLKPIIAEYYFASAYYNDVAKNKAANDEEIAAYYEENVDLYDSVDYLMVEVAAQIPEGETVTAEDGTTTTEDPTDEQIATAMEAAKVEADAKLETIASDGELQENKKASSVANANKEWLFDAARKAGDTTVIEDSANNKYFVLQFEDRYLDQTKTVNVRVLATTEDNGEKLVDEWNTTGANEDAFIALVENYSEDAYTSTNGGLYENLVATGLSEELKIWLMDASRQSGDVTSILSTDGYTYVMYFVGQGKPEWKASIASTLLSETMSNYLADIISDVEVTDVKGKLTYLKVLAAEKAAAEATPETTDETVNSSETDGSN